MQWYTVRADEFPAAGTRPRVFGRLEQVVNDLAYLVERGYEWESWVLVEGGQNILKSQVAIEAVEQ